MLCNVTNCCAHVIQVGFHPVDSDNHVKPCTRRTVGRRYRYYAEIRDVHHSYRLVDSGWFDSMADAMHWLANQPRAYDGFTTIELWKDKSEYMCTLWCQ